MPRTIGQQVLFTLVLFLWAAINIGDGAWIYYYITTIIHPNPNTVLNTVWARWSVFKAMMFFFGFIWGFVNFIFWLMYVGLDIRLLTGLALHRAGRKTCWWPPPLHPLFGTRDTKDKATLPTNVTAGRIDNKTERGLLYQVFNRLLLFPLAITMIIGPFFSPLFALPLAQQAAWDHGCNRYPSQIILDARSDDQNNAFNSNSIPNVAHFFAGQSPTYTYELNSVSTNEWQFNLWTIDSTTLAQNLSALDYPSIRSITYNFVNNTVLGYCTPPSSSDTIFACITGSFNPNNYLSFNLTDLRSNTTSHLSAVDKQWVFGDGAPNALIRDEYGAEVLKTDITKRGDCTQLKMCAAKQAGPDLIVPTGFFLLQQVDFALKCTNMVIAGKS